MTQRDVDFPEKSGQKRNKSLCLAWVAGYDVGIVRKLPPSERFKASLVGAALIVGWCLHTGTLFLGLAPWLDSSLFCFTIAASVSTVLVLFELAVGLRTRHRRAVSRPQKSASSCVIGAIGVLAPYIVPILLLSVIALSYQLIIFSGDIAEQRVLLQVEADAALRREHEATVLANQAKRVQAHATLREEFDRRRAVAEAQHLERVALQGKVSTVRSQIEQSLAGRNRSLQLANCEIQGTRAEAFGCQEGSGIMGAGKMLRFHEKEAFRQAQSLETYEAILAQLQADLRELPEAAVVGEVPELESVSAAQQQAMITRLVAEDPRRQLIREDSLSSMLLALDRVVNLSDMHQKMFWFVKLAIFTVESITLSIVIIMPGGLYEQRLGELLREEALMCEREQRLREHQKQLLEADIAYGTRKKAARVHDLLPKEKR